MNIRNTVRNISLAGAVAAIPIGAAYAAPALLGSVIDQAGAPGAASFAGCSNSGTTCSTVATGEGFIQESIDVGGTLYYRTVVAETDAAEGNFGMETFVLGGNSSTKGILARETVTGASTEGSDQFASALNDAEGFYYNTDLALGWANTSASGGVTIESSANSTAQNFKSAFSFHENASDMGGAGFNDNGEYYNKQLKISSHQVSDGSIGGFSLTDLDYSGSSVSLSSEESFSMTVGGTNFTNTNVGDGLRVLWLGQNLGSTFGLEDVGTGIDHAGTVAATASGLGNDSQATSGFTGTTPTTSAGFGWDTNLDSTPFQPSF